MNKRSYIYQVEAEKQTELKARYFEYLIRCCKVTENNEFEVTVESNSATGVDESDYRLIVDWVSTLSRLLLRLAEINGDWSDDALTVVEAIYFSVHIDFESRKPLARVLVLNYDEISNAYDNANHIFDQFSNQSWPWG